MKNLKRKLEELEKNPVEKHDPLVEAGTFADCIESVSGRGFSAALIFSRIGLGTHAEVYECRPLLTEDWNQDGTFAIKVEKPVQHAAGTLFNEIDILKKMSGSGVTPEYLGAFNVKIEGLDCLAAGLELFDDSLSSLKFRKESGKPLPHEFRDWLMVNMFNCVFGMHSHGFLHRDIKPSNIMYKLARDSQGKLNVRFALVDFGSSIPMGEKNESPFRGTGAYSALNSDPTESRSLDDYWSTAFSILDLCLDGGLPWRNISARSEDGRVEILKQKNELLSSVFHGNQPQVSSFLGQVLALLFHTSSSEPVESFKAQFRRIESEFPVPIPYPTMLDILRPQNCWRLDLPKPLRKTPVHFLLLDKDNRGSLGSAKSHCYPFFLERDSLKPESFQKAVLSILAAGAQASSLPSQFFCLLEARGQACNIKKCPLLHVAGQGITRSAVLRSLRRDPACVEFVLDGRKCRSSDCQFRHPPTSELKTIFLNSSS